MTWRILTVDDEEDVRMIVRTTLQDKYEVVEAHDGLDALEKLERYDPDFIVMDVMMPLMNGFEACKAIRNNPKFKNVPVLFLSALSSKDDMMKGYDSGADLYLTKPFEPARLLKNIDVFFERTPPPKKQNRKSIDEIKKAEKEGKVPAAPGASSWETDTPSTPPPRAAPAPKTAPESAKAPQQKATPDKIERTEAGELKPRVLVVDDDQEISSLMRMTLMDVYETVFAVDGMDAIEKLVKYQPDLLIIDVMLPKMNGYQLVQSLRSNRAFSRMPILMCSAKSSDKDINMAKRLGADDYLTKPFSATELLSRMENLRNASSFRVRPKSLSYDQILEMENPDAGEDVFQQDDGARHAAAQNNKEMKKFLAEQGKKGALDREKPEEKKKKRFFGFGR